MFQHLEYFYVPRVYYMIAPLETVLQWIVHCE